MRKLFAFVLKHRGTNLCLYCSVVFSSKCPSFLFIVVIEGSTGVLFFLFSLSVARFLQSTKSIYYLIHISSIIWQMKEQYVFEFIELNNKNNAKVRHRRKSRRLDCFTLLLFYMNVGKKKVQCTSGKTHRHTRSMLSCLLLHTICHH